MHPHEGLRARALALEHTGNVYSCDHFVEPRYKLGNIKELPLVELVALPQQRQFGLDKRDTLPQYGLDCDVRFACHGGCPNDRFITTPTGDPGLSYLCAGFKDFFHHVDRPMRIMGSLLAQNPRPPGSSSCTPPRTQNAAVTTPAPAAPATSGSTATAADERPQSGSAARVSRPDGSSLSPVTYEQWITEVVKVVETVGSGIMVIGGLGAFLAFVRDAATDARKAGSYERLRRNLGRCILLGLEVLIVADIVRTVVVDQTFESVTVLGIIVLIRILLSFSLDVEIDGVWPWNRLRETRNDQAP
jgi:radical SAM protein with 4Fe4S-binding SPASM domain